MGQLRSSGAVVNSAIVRAVARCIIFAKDANLLEENGGGINLMKGPQPQQKGPLFYMSPCCKAMFLPPLLSMSLDIRDKLIQVIGYINNINSQVPICINKNTKIQFSWQFAKISSRKNFQVHGMPIKVPSKMDSQENFIPRSMTVTILAVAIPLA